MSCNVDTGYFTVGLVIISIGACRWISGVMTAETSKVVMVILTASFVVSTTASKETGFCADVSFDAFTVSIEANPEDAEGSDEAMFIMSA